MAQGQDQLAIGGQYGSDPQADLREQLYSHLDLDMPIKVGTRINVTPSQRGRVTKVDSKGVEVLLDSGEKKRISEVNGRPVMRSVVETTKQQMTGVDRMGNPRYQQVPDKVRWEIDPEVLRTTDGSVELAPERKEELVDTRTMRQIVEELDLSAQDADPAKRQRFLDVQEKLYKAGFYGETGYIPGLPTPTFHKALSDALEVAARTNQTLDEVLDQGMATAGQRGKQGQPFVATLSSPDELRQVVEKVATVVLGQDLPPDVKERIWQDYRSAEYSAQRSAYDLKTEPDSKGGAVTAVPDFEAFAAQRVREADPAGAEATEFADRAKTFYEMLDGF